MISVCIPFFRNVTYLSEALASVLAQQRCVREIIVLDDSPSEDVACDARRMCDQLNVGYYRNRPALGMVGNWNAAIDAARTEHITILHGDDVLVQDYVSIIAALIEQFPHAVAYYCGARSVNHRGQPLRCFSDAVKRWLDPAARDGTSLLQGRHGLERLLRGNFIFCPSICWNRTVLGAKRFNPQYRFVPDYALLLELLASGRSVVGSGRVGLYYRRHGESTTSTLETDGRRFEEEAAFYRALSGQLRDEGRMRASRIARRRLVFRGLVVKAALSAVAHRHFPLAIKLGRLVLDW